MLCSSLNEDSLLTPPGPPGPGLIHTVLVPGLVPVVSGVLAPDASLESLEHLGSSVVEDT